MTFRGEGPLLGYHELLHEDVSVIAVLFPPTYKISAKDGSAAYSEIPDKVKNFFAGVGIPIIRTRLPFDEMVGAEAHNREMSIIRKALGIFGGSMPLAIQAVLQATDGGYIEPGELVIAVTSDTALCVTASTTKDFLSATSGIQVNEIICKSRRYTIARPDQPKLTIAASAEVPALGDRVIDAESPIK